MNEAGGYVLFAVFSTLFLIFTIYITKEIEHES